MSDSESIKEISYLDYEYPFENLVFEGGGAKGKVYIGCLKVLEEVGIKPKRVAGTSVGAIFAALLASGFTSAEIESVQEVDAEELFIDHSCGICSFLPNLLLRFGWNPANRFTNFFGQLLERKLGNADITFSQLNKMTGVELCVCAVNVNMMSVEYFHPKTTPNMAVCLAVRMSLSLPGLLQAVQVPNGIGKTDVYVDGGLITNYPIHAFDGWWLSMKSEDSFLNRIQPLSQIHSLLDEKKRFGEYNEKTLGFMVYSWKDQGPLKHELEKRVGFKDAERPESSKLYRGKKHRLRVKNEALEKHEDFLNAVDKFMKVLNEVNKHGRESRETDHIIDKDELRQALRVAMGEKRNEDTTIEEEFTRPQLELLFGPDVDMDNVFEELDADGSGDISYDELLLFIGRCGLNIQEKFLGVDRHEISNLRDYIQGIQHSMLDNIKRLYVGEKDMERTVGVSSDYVETRDFTMEAVDREFCTNQGQKATALFLQNYAYKNKLSKKLKTTEIN